MRINDHDALRAGKRVISCCLELCVMRSIPTIEVPLTPSRFHRKANLLAIVPAFIEDAEPECGHRFIFIALKPLGIKRETTDRKRDARRIHSARIKQFIGEVIRRSRKMLRERGIIDDEVSAAIRGDDGAGMRDVEDDWGHGRVVMPSGVDPFVCLSQDRVRDYAVYLTGLLAKVLQRVGLSKQTALPALARSSTCSRCALNNNQPCSLHDPIGSRLRASRTRLRM